MGRVLTNFTSFSYNNETSPGTAGTVWFQMEPNEINSYGAQITTVERNPISKNRQRRKGTVTDLDSEVEFVVDFTISSFRDFIEAYSFVVGINTDVTQLVTTAAVGGVTDAYTVSALSAAQASKFVIGSLLWVTGFTNSANIYLKEVETAASASDTAISVVENLEDETRDGRLSFGGYRVPAATTVTWTWDAGSSQATLNATGLGTLLSGLALTPGQMVHIGSVATLGGAIQNAFTANAFGYARVVSIPDADNVVFDKVDVALQSSQSDPATALDIVFDEFIRNQQVDDSEYLTRTIQFEAAYPNLGDGTVGNTDEGYEYSVENYGNTLAWELPLADKALITYNFIGTDTEVPTTSRKTGADSASVPTQTAALNTSQDIARLRIQDVDENGLTTDFRELTITLDNEVSGERVLGQLGPKFINTGNFLVNLEGQLLFTNPNVIAAIRNNQTLTMDFIVKNDDGVVAVDIPSMIFGEGGDKEFPVNESVLVNMTAQAFGDPILNTSIGISIFSVPLP